ncbi:hypothetical protein HD554DRAFT_2021763 [Boletus coccyginus]|nr:hypothetical protein HD554DRAFT_2021763 [Boletus coccyginus]
MCVLFACSSLTRSRPCSFRPCFPPQDDTRACVIRGKDASSFLIDLAEAIQASATRDEVEVLIEGMLLQETHPFDLIVLDWSHPLWIACHDKDEQNARLASHVWEDNELDVSEGFFGDMLAFLGHEHAYVRTSSVAAIAAAGVELHLQGTIDALQALYRGQILAPEFDQYRMVIAQSLDHMDLWPTWVVIAFAFERLAPSFPGTQVESFFRFLIQDKALGGRPADVRREMLQAGAAVIDHHGASQLAGLLSAFETHLAGTSPANKTGDQIKEAVIILFGRAARHLAASDPRILGIVDRLVEALQTPSEQVQMAMSDCLVPPVTLMGQDRSAQLIDALFKTLFDAPKYATRHGVAYGLATQAIKGLGIGAMKRYDVIERLRVAGKDKKQFELRHGAMFSFETLSSTLERLFEPYSVIQKLQRKQEILVTSPLPPPLMPKISQVAPLLLLPSSFLFISPFPASLLQWTNSSHIFSVTSHSLNLSTSEIGREKLIEHTFTTNPEHPSVLNHRQLSNPMHTCCWLAIASSAAYMYKASVNQPCGKNPDPINCRW